MKAKKELIPVTLLTGYLGAGKTTLLNYVLNNQKGYKVAVIVNDIGEVNIDAALISKEASIVEEDKDSLVPLQNGCICCTLKTDLMNQIISLAETGKFDYILIEASGICEPMPIAQSIMALSGETGEKSIPAVVKLDNIVTVVDALRLVTEFAGGNSLLNQNLDEEDIEGLLIQQIEFCNTILINKTDLVTEEQLKEVKSVVRTLQPSANMIETQKGVVDLSMILGTNSFDFEKVYGELGKGFIHIHSMLKNINQVNINMNTITSITTMMKTALVDVMITNITTNMMKTVLAAVMTMSTTIITKNTNTITNMGKNVAVVVIITITEKVKQKNMELEPLFTMFAVHLTA